MAIAASARSSSRTRRDETRSKLMMAALKLSEAAPFRDLTVDGIAAEVGISRSAFYLHFRDKHDLLLAAVEEVSSELPQTAERWWLSEGAPAERVRLAVSAMVALYAENATLLRLVTEVSTYDEEVGERWRAVVARFIERSSRQIAAEQRKGLVGRHLDATATAEALVWMVERCCYVYLPGGERTAEEVIEQLASVWTAALYPGVIAADELRPDAVAGPLWGVPPPRF